MASQRFVFVSPYYYLIVCLKNNKWYVKCVKVHFVRRFVHRPFALTYYAILTNLSTLTLSDSTCAQTRYLCR